MKHQLFIVSLFISIIARAQPGTLDLTFSPGTDTTNTNGHTTSIALQSDGKLLLGGWFTVFNGISANRIIRLNKDDGSVDTTFQTGTGADYSVAKILIQPDGKIIAGGQFIHFDSVLVNRIVRLNQDGTVDTTFKTGIGFNNEIYDMALQTDGKIVAGGIFTEYNGVVCNRLARLNTDGSYDTTFNTITGASASVNTVTIQPDGKIMIGGDFTFYDGGLNWRIARANTDGSRDITFLDTIGASRVVEAIAIQPNGSMIVGGNFNYFSLGNANKLIRLFPDGYIDISFMVDQGVNYVIRDIELNNGMVLLGGAFTTFKNMPVKGLVKVNDNCNIDTTFKTGSGVEWEVFDILLQPDGKILIGGSFISYNGIARAGIARIYNCLTPQPDSIYGLSYAECNGTPQTYYVPPVAGATKYEWTLPNGWTGTSDSASITAISDGSGGTISVKAFTDSCGYSYATTLNIATVQPPGVDICLVTVDDSSTHNIIVWEKPATTLIDSFFIYRETTTNVYTKIGAVSYDSLSEYHDLDTNANPNSTSFRYKLSVKDTCGAESALSPFHNTIHLQNLGGGNFQWTFYQIENAPNPVMSFNMNRDAFANGSFFPIGLIPGTNATFTDLTASSFPDAEYRVDVNWNISCSPSRATINTTRSNIKRKFADSLITRIDDLLAATIRIYPNPAEKMLNIELDKSITAHQWQLLNSLGQTVWRQKPESNVTGIDVSPFSKGIYLLMIETDKGVLKRKVLIR
jgi:uncharacterized delta-60 repeat protein